MARHGPTSLVAWIAGLDLAGPGALSEANDGPLTAQRTPTTPLGPNGSIRQNSPTGTIEYSIAETGWYDRTARSIRDLLVAGAPAYPWPSIFGHAGGTIGSPVRLATHMRLGSHDVLASLDDLTKLAVEYYAATGCAVHQDALLLAHGVVDNVVDNGTSPAAAYRHDNGASSDGGATVCIMADVPESRWRGYPTLTLRLRHSTTAGSGYANLGPALTLDRDDNGAVVFEIPSGTTISRYLAVRFTFSGARDAFEAAGAHSFGDTVFNVDGGTGLERIEVGDILQVAGHQNTVETAEHIGGGRWRLTIDGGLGGPLADNAPVDVIGTNTSLRYAAAIERR